MAATIPSMTLKKMLNDVDMDQAVLSYDRESDTLMLHLYGRGHAGVSRYVTDDLMIRLGTDHKTVIGFQVEHFLGRVVPEHPALLDALDIAELRGISPEEVASMRRELGRTHRATALAELITAFSSFEPTAN